MVKGEKMITPLLIFLLSYIGARVEATWIYWVILVLFGAVGLYKELIHHK
jgi:hypothetical protein